MVIAGLIGLGIYLSKVGIFAPYQNRPPNAGLSLPLIEDKG